jgi:hypothetical protein
MLTIFGSRALDHDALIQDLTKEVARVTRANLAPSAANMNVAELRGYLRARTTHAAKEQVRQVVNKVRLPAKSEAALTAIVAERAMPLPHVQSRAA